MEYRLSMIDNNKKISIINDRIKILSDYRELLERDISTVNETPSMDRITIVKIQAQIDDIDAKIQALEAEKLLTQ